MMSRIGVLLEIASLVGCWAAIQGLQSATGEGLAARQAGVTLDLLSYNTYGLPSPIGKDLAKRFTAMPAALEGHDVVGLQETFTNESKRLLDSKA